LSGGEKEKASRPARPPVPRLEVKDLLAGSREAVLVLGRDEYRLRLTSNRKLILTK
jgi:hemin uptake protein HemP